MQAAAPTVPAVPVPELLPPDYFEATVAADTVLAAPVHPTNPFADDMAVAAAPEAKPEMTRKPAIPPKPANLLLSLERGEKRPQPAPAPRRSGLIGRLMARFEPPSG